MDGQLYTSADPTKNGVTVAKVGTGLPTTEGQTITNLPFETERPPKQPYSFACSRSASAARPTRSTSPTTNATGGRQVLPHRRQMGRIRLGRSAVRAGLTANDNNGVVTIYATSVGEKGIEGTLYKINDVSGFGGTLSRRRPGNRQSAAERGLPRASPSRPERQSGRAARRRAAPTINDRRRARRRRSATPPTRPTPITIGDRGYAASELTVTVHSSNTDGRSAGQHQCHRKRQRTDAARHSGGGRVNRSCR